MIDDIETLTKVVQMAMNKGLKSVTVIVRDDDDPTFKEQHFSVDTTGRTVEEIVELIRTGQGQTVH